jgi:hypothetical protein
VRVQDYHTFAANSIMKRIVFFGIAMITTSLIYGQDRIVKDMIAEDLEWGEGSIILTDQTEIMGLVKFNDKSGLLSYTEGNDSRSFTARSVLGFEFFDEKIGRQRVFYTLEYAGKEDQLKRPVFFEVLKDFNDFAVLAKTDPTEFEVKNYTSGAAINGIPIASSNGPTTTKMYYSQTVFILTPSGDLKPYVKLIHKIVDKDRGFWSDADRELTREKFKSKILDNDLLEKHFPEPGYSHMMDFVAENRLDLETKEDLIKALEYYKTIRN